MSRSPKYASAELAAARERELQQRRRQRERERQAREAAARARRLEADRSALLRDAGSVRGSAAGTAGSAADAGLANRSATLLAQIDGIASAARAAQDEDQLAAGRARLSAVQREAAGIAVDAATILATRERQGALAAVRAMAAGVPDRAEMDPAGAATVDRLLALAEVKVGDASRFDAACAELGDAMRSHLARAQGRREALAQMRRECAAARAVLSQVLDEARAADAELPAAAGAERLMADLAATAAAEDVPGALSLAARARDMASALEGDFDRWLDQLDRAQLVFEAVTRALPRAGFTVLADSYAVQGASVSISAERSDGSVVQMAFVPDESDRVDIVYHADATDFVIEQTVDGEVARCELTEEILERFHAELEAEDVVTGELRWTGKPATRPDAREARTHWKPTSQSRQVQ